jgi:hypothetical protein
MTNPGTIKTLEAGRINLGLSISLVVTAALVIVIGHTEQAFAAYGTIKKYSLPATYLTFLVLLLRRAPADYPLVAQTHPMWYRWLGLAVGLSTIYYTFLAPHDAQSINIAQGLALFVGFLLLGRIGLHTPLWTDGERRKLLLLLGGAALVAGLLGRSGLGSYTALVVPCAAASVYLGGTVPAHRLAFFGLAAVYSLLEWRTLYLGTTEPPSMAVLAQIGSCVALLLLLSLPRPFRRPLLAVILVGAAVETARSGLVRVTLGSVNFTDVTLAERGYETDRVFHLLGSSPAALILGLGPGGGVDLTFAPDARTLAASGRNLGSVDDVHLLTSYLLLKFGLLGLVWLTFVVLAIAKIINRVVLTADGDSWDVLLTLFAISSFVDGVPAATNIFANPVLPLMLGCLWSRGHAPRPVVPARWS